MPLRDDLHRVNPGPFGGFVTNHAMVGSGKDGLETAGDSIDGTTMFGEGSIGKVRFAGLAYMLQEKDVINLQSNAKDFFASERMKGFLEKRYPGKAEAMQAEIGKFFTGSSVDATLADLTTHHAGIGDLTRDHIKLLERDGVEHQYTLPELLIYTLPEGDSAVPRDAAGKPRAQSGSDTPNENLPEGKRGTHQYSNLGYMLLGLAMEEAYDAKHPSDKPKDYKQLTRELMLEPLELKHTKFPENILPEDNVARTPWIDRGALADATKCSSANAAGGMFVSADDSAKFFAEFFRGFPGTPEYGKGANKFFNDKTIKAMEEEWKKQTVPANQGDIDAGRQDFRRFQGPGFTVDIDKDGNAISYGKGGGTAGYASNMSFDPKTGVVSIGMAARENVSDAAVAAMAESAGRSVDEIQKEFTKNEIFDRAAMTQEMQRMLEGINPADKMILEQAVELMKALDAKPDSALDAARKEAGEVIKDLLSSGASSGGDEKEGAGNLPDVKQQEQQEKDGQGR